MQPALVKRFRDVVQHYLAVYLLHHVYFVATDLSDCSVIGSSQKMLALKGQATLPVFDQIGLTQTLRSMLGIPEVL